MKSQNNLTHQEIMDGLTYCFRELISTEVTHRSMPNIINRGRAVAAIVTSAHREELMDMKRTNASVKLLKAEKPTMKKLSKEQGG